jgi:hypothetical protein
VPAGRLGQPSQVTDLAAAILAKAYLTNQVISLDGGSYPRQAPDGIHHGARTSWPAPADIGSAVIHDHQDDDRYAAEADIHPRSDDA